MPQPDVNALEIHLQNAEEAVEKLKKRVELMQQCLEQNQSSTRSDLFQSNAKLKHRICILKNAIEEEKTKGEKMSNVESSKGILDGLNTLFKRAVSKAYPMVDVAVPVVPSTRPQFGDYQCNAAMPIANYLTSQGAGIPLMTVAAKILKNVENCEMIEKVEIASPGFLNIWLSLDFCRTEVRRIVLDGVKPPPQIEKKSVVVDFSSPNIAKEMHVGHLRSTIIGESICRLLEFLGHQVLRINHVGDWGTQFGMLIAHLQEIFPNYLTVAPPISDLQAFYKESKKRFDEDQEFRSKAYNCVVKLQSKDPDYIKAWNLICDVSRKEFQIIYDRLDIVVEERGESFYQSRMEALVKELKEKNFLEEDEGRLVLFGNSGGIPMTVVKSDGGFTYDTSDLATIKQRIEEEKADWLIYVTDSGQAVHFKILFDCSQKIGILDPKKVRTDHVTFGVVLGEDKKKFKTRSGDTVRLNDLLKEGVKRAEEKLMEKNRHTVLNQQELDAAKEAVAFGCIKYADLSHNRINDYIFSFDKMLEDKGNTAVYLLYALTRIRSIARNAEVSSEDLRKEASKGEITLSDEKEWKLVKTLLRFNDILLKIIDDLYLHYLCEYLYEISTVFSDFYSTCYCIEKDAKTKETRIRMDRLLLCEATALTMEKCFHILGLKTVSKM